MAEPNIDYDDLDYEQWAEIARLRRVVVVMESREAVAVKDSLFAQARVKEARVAARKARDAMIQALWPEPEQPPVPAVQEPGA
ncbi:hypothetical protein LCGC14_0273190 [marine sediment metagenome]|uniref:Uncharacterized protein n=2 Tax=root TaxID=1 RepID=A0A9C9NGR7_9HYPH|nr:hypothetical protein [Aurantimonas coralicida]